MRLAIIQHRRALVQLHVNADRWRVVARAGQLYFDRAPVASIVDPQARTIEVCDTTPLAAFGEAIARAIDVSLRTRR